MRYDRSMSSRAAGMATGIVVALALASGACTLFTDLGGLSEDAGPEPPDATSPEAAADGSARADDAGEGGARIDAAGRSAYEQAVIADAPSAWFRFEETSGSAARDETGGSDGTYAPSGVELGLAGAMAASRAVRLDGSKGRVSLGPRLPFVGRAAMSVELWLNPDVVDGQVRRAFSRKPPVTAQGNEYTIQASDSQLLFQRLTANGNSYAAGPPLVVGRWTHVVATFGERTKLYMDGVEVGDGQAVGDLTDEPGSDMVVGDTAAELFFKWQGLIDEVAVYDKALTPERVLAHFQAARP